MAPLLVCWKIRGLCQPIRFLLAYAAGEDWEEKFYDGSSVEIWTSSPWFKEKANVGLDFPNLPYLIDGKFKITQSNAIIRYLARKYSLDGKTEEERVKLDILEGQYSDFRMALSMLVYGKEFETAKTKYLTDLPGRLKSWSQFLGNNTWLMGSKISYVDFLLYEMLYQHDKAFSGCLQDFPTLKSYINRVEALDNIAKYRKSDNYVESPYNSPFASFNM